MSHLNLHWGETKCATVFVAGIRWHIAPVEGNPLTAECLDLERHIGGFTARVVKTGPHRTVYQVQANGASVFWKHCRISGLRGWLRQCLRPPKARMEFDRALSLAKRGILTVEPLAWGVRDGEFAGESFLITRELAGATPLQHFLLDRVYHASGRRAMADCLGRFIALLHDAGVSHPDLHPGNILVVEDEHGMPRFHLIDLHSIELGPPLSWPKSRDNLVIFNRWFAVRSTRSDRHRFWQSYVLARQWKRDSLQARSRELESQTTASNTRFWFGRDQRCLGTNRYFRRVRSRSACGFAVREMDESALKRLLDDPDSPFHDKQSRLIKDSRTSTVTEIVVSTSEGPRTMIWKRFRVKKILTPLFNRLRQSPALRSWQLGHALIHRNLPTPRPWMVLHRRSLAGPREGYLLCEKVEDAGDLVQAVVGSSRREKWAHIDRIARMVRQFHKAGLSHRDLKAANLLYSKTAGADSFHFIDLVGVRRHRRVSNRLKVRDLTRLNVSFIKSLHATRTDRLRFLRIYLCWALDGRLNWKDWWRRIEQASRRKVARNERLGRILS